MGVEISVVLCTRDPRPEYLARVLAALEAQTLPAARWELVLVDNGSARPVAGSFDLSRLPATTLHEGRQGQVNAFLCGLAASSGDLVLLLDDDNVLDADYLEQAVAAFARHPFVGVAMARVRGEFEVPPPPWLAAVAGHLAIRDGGDRTLYSLLPGLEGVEIAGAGMVVRRAGALRYAEEVAGDARHLAFQRTATSLIGAGDVDLALAFFDLGLARAYFPELRLTHLVPAFRLAEGYMLRLVQANCHAGELVQLVRGILRPRPPKRKPLRHRPLAPFRELLLSALAIASRGFMAWRIERAQQRGAADAHAAFRERFSAPFGPPQRGPAPLAPTPAARAGDVAR